MCRTDRESPVSSLVRTNSLTDSPNQKPTSTLKKVSKKTAKRKDTPKTTLTPKPKVSKTKKTGAFDEDDMKTPIRKMISKLEVKTDIYICICALKVL